VVYFCFYLIFPRYYKRDKEAKDAEGQLQGLLKELADLEGKLAVSEQQRKHWEREYNDSTLTTCIFNYSCIIIP
jgi:hypothetical protein